MNAAQQPLIEARDLRVGFGGERQPAREVLHGVSFAIPENRTLGLVGESGSGKSLTALAMLGLLPRGAVVSPGSRILFRGSDLLRLGARDWQRVRGREMGMIFQEPMSSLNPVFSIGFQLGEVLRRHLGMPRRQARERAIELLEETGIPQPQRRIDAYPHQLSGGQQQRAMIAMAIACEPRLLIADEPTTALDVTVQKQILELIAGLQQRRRMSVLFISHDLAVVGRVAHEVLVMREGDIREQGEASEVFGRPRDAYTRALLACRPRLDSRPLRLPVLDDAAKLPEAVPQADAEQRSRGLRGDEPVVLEARGLSKSFYERDGLFGTREFGAVEDVSFKLAGGKTLGVVGESGSGKTTLALMLMRLTPASGGKVLFGGQDWLALSSDQALPHKRRMQIVFQNPYASLNPRFTVARILEEPLLIHEPGLGAAGRRDRALVLLDQVGLPRSALARYPHEFSGGQRQRIAIARCLSLRPEVLICDESVSALDVSVQAQVLNLLQDLQDELGMSYLFISHDLAVVKYMADEIMVMKEGRVVELAGSDDIHARPRHPYTQQLLSALPEA